MKRPIFLVPAVLIAGGFKGAWGPVWLTTLLRNSGFFVIATFPIPGHLKSSMRSHSQ
jgi:hypothetical protein